ncbi:hypothetical protein O4D10_11530 [Xanthomonas citri pv. citri]|uniref:hypothetical protein n=1 Tax=Xanthomonas citri TaxID=346 RepID=UPI0036DEB4DA
MRIIWAFPVLLLTGCVTLQPYPKLPREGNATLDFSGAQLSQFSFMPDGKKCGGSVGMQIGPEENPFLRQDRLMTLDASKRSAMLFVWLGGPGGMLGACHVIISFKLVPNGRYRLATRRDSDACGASIVPLDSKSSQGFSQQQMKWTGFKVPSECKPIE